MSEIWHHGILGQKWGKKNGPPYPLDAGDHSAREKKAGWRKSLNKGGDTSDGKSKGKSENEQSGRTRKGLSDKQKKALIITGATLATAVAAYGIYKYSRMNSDSVERGQRLLGAAIEKHGQTPMALLPGASEAAGNAASKVGQKIKETLDDSLRNANPLGKRDNCTSCSVSGILRTLGINATAKDCGYKSLEDVMSAGFKGVRGVEATAVGFGQSPQKAAAMLLKRYGENAKGVCGVQWTGGRGGHAFSWIIENGKVTFLDFQSALKGASLDRFWNNIDRNGPLEMYRLDNVLDKLDASAMSQYIDFH